jgi:hypothetical protein
MVDAAAYLPDGDPVKGYLADKIRNNLEWADKYAQTHVTPLGTCFEGQAPEQVGTEVWAIPRPWQNNYLAWSLDHANQQGFHPGTKLRDRLVRFQLSLFTSADYERPYAGAYTLIVGRKLGDERIDYFKTLAEVFAATYGKPPGKPTRFADYYGVDARLMLMIARHNRWAGAEEAYAFLFPQLALPSIEQPFPDLARRAGWALAFEGEP